MLTERQEQVKDLITEDALLHAYSYGLESATDYVSEQVSEHNIGVEFDALDGVISMEESKMLRIETDDGQALQNDRRELMDDTYSIVRHFQTA